MTTLLNEALNNFSSMSGYSQFNEDAIIACVFNKIGVKHKVAVEFGAGDGLSCSNTAALWKHQGWKAILVEPDHEKYELLEGNTRLYDVVCRSGYITPEGSYSIDSILAQEEISDIDFMSIDVDGNDIFIFESLQCRPRAICVEFNPTIPPHLEVRQSEMGECFGASLLALVKAGERIGYEFVGANYCNAFFVLKSESTPFLEYERNPEILFEPYRYTYAVTDFSGRITLIGQPLPWGPTDPYVLPVEAPGTIVSMPTDSPQQIRRGFESLWGPAVWLSHNGLTQEHYVGVLSNRPQLVCVDLTQVPLGSEMEVWLQTDALALSYRPIFAGRILGLVKEKD